MKKIIVFLVIFSFIDNSYSQLNYQWANSPQNYFPNMIGGKTVANSIKSDAIGNSYVTGYFEKSAAFNTNFSDTATLTAAGGFDFFFAKYDPTGNFVFTKRIGGISSEIKSSIAIDSNNNIYITGSFIGTVDFDPSVNIYNLTSAGVDDIFFAKYDSNGNFVFAKKIGNLNTDFSNDIKIDISGYICITGAYTGTVDFDPNSGISNLVSNAGSLDMFIAKYDPNGNYIFAISMGGNLTDVINSMSTDVSGNIYISGSYEGTADFDPTSGINNLTSSGDFDVFLAKYDVGGNLVFADRFGSSGYDRGRGVINDAYGNSYITGNYSGTADFDPSAGFMNLTSIGNNDIFIAKYNSIGALVFAKSIGGLNDDESASIVLDGSNNIFITGSFSGTVDFDPSPSFMNITSFYSFNDYNGITISYKDVFFAKYDSLGNYIFVNDIKGNNSSINNTGNFIAIDSSNNILICGIFDALTDFDPSINNTDLLAPNGIDNGFLAKYDNLGISLWANKIGGLPQYADNIIIGTKKDLFGNFITVLNLNGVSDFDPGMGVSILQGQPSMAIVKYDSLGNLIFAKEKLCTNANSFQLDSLGNIYILSGLDFSKYNNSGNLIFNKTLTDSSISVYMSNISLDKNNNIYITGIFRGFGINGPGCIDFDPSSGVSKLFAPSSSNYSLFIAKYDSLGIYLYANIIGASTSNIQTVSLVIDSLDNIYIAGKFTSTVDFDMGLGTLNLTAPPANGTGYIAKYDPIGNLIFAKKLSSSTSSSFDLLKLNGDYIYTTGYFQGTADFDLNTGFANLISVGSSVNSFIAKYDLSGNLIFAKKFNGNALCASLYVDKNERIFLTGTVYGTVDFDLSIAGIANLISAGMGDIYIAKYDSSGNYIYANRIGGTGSNSDNGVSIIFDNKENIYLSGLYSGTVDFDIGPGISNLQTSYQRNVFFGKWKEDPCFNNILIIDSSFNVSCNSLGYASAQTINSTPPYSFSWNTTPVTSDSIAHFNTSGIYTLTLMDSLGCNLQRNVLINAPSSISNFDLNVNLISTNYRVGRYSTIWLDAFNDGCIPTSGNLQIILDSLETFSSAMPSPNIISGDTLTWNFNNLIYDSMHVTPYITIHTPLWAIIGDTVCFKVIINPITGDANATNNSKKYYFPVMNSYDPNDKKVYPHGLCTQGYINNNQLLTYTVRFQNTGNNTAINIFVMDTLDANLDLNSVRVIGNSHALITEVLPGNVLKFRFDNINLADSTSNESESHGYVIFEVMPNNNLINGTSIKNDVGIYFDFNPPVYTNTVSNTISDGTVNSGTTVMGNTISANLSGGIYQWLNCNNNNAIISGETNQNYTPTQSGIYSVIVSDGCFSDTSSCVAISVIGISEMENIHQFSFYPNPSNNAIIINTNQSTQIKIVNLLGEILLEKNVQNKSVIDISELTTGIYFIETKEGYTTKLIKQ